MTCQCCSVRSRAGRGPDVKLTISKSCAARARRRNPAPAGGARPGGRGKTGQRKVPTPAVLHQLRTQLQEEAARAYLYAWRRWRAEWDLHICQHRHKALTNYQEMHDYVDMPQPPYQSQLLESWRQVCPCCAARVSALNVPQSWLGCPAGTRLVLDPGVCCFRRSADNDAAEDTISKLRSFDILQAELALQRQNKLSAQKEYSRLSAKANELNAWLQGEGSAVMARRRQDAALFRQAAVSGRVRGADKFLHELHEDVLFANKTLTMRRTRTDVDLPLTHDWRRLVQNDDSGALGGTFLEVVGSPVRVQWKWVRQDRARMEWLLRGEGLFPRYSFERAQRELVRRLSRCYKPAGRDWRANDRIFVIAQGQPIAIRDDSMWDIYEFICRPVFGYLW